MQHAFADLMREESSYEDLSNFYQKKRDFFCEAISTSRFKFIPTEGTYFQMLDYSSISEEEDLDLAKRWTREKGIASIPISPFYKAAPEQSYLRFCFAKNEETLSKGAEILNAL